MDAWKDGRANENGELSITLADAHGPKRVLLDLNSSVGPNHRVMPGSPHVTSLELASPPWNKSQLMG